MTEHLMAVITVTQIVEAPDPIRVWEFHEAPELFRRMSTNGGGEEWLALIPPGGDVPEWMESECGYHRGAFAVCDNEIHRLANGATIVIGSHT